MKPKRSKATAFTKDEKKLYTSKSPEFKKIEKYYKASQKIKRVIAQIGKLEKSIAKDQKELDNFAFDLLTKKKFSDILLEEKLYLTLQRISKNLKNEQLQEFLDGFDK